ncbi:GTP cyclohydrolase II [Chengkuizengella axinellae]|uniref:GTP cyclohydrolase II n=1 Tax=Chengkuizengella axinellae TaxID=3064388 RepID=A0ABT9IZP3_9BACL|nr:GTP cyclohydrolase II [Chengkuizengella sp. 2205SS18-9]MDP5274849.1 GTP cyclohydrolase II [Chengkuizengella sp. 2205SS18-9]
MINEVSIELIKDKIQIIEHHEQKICLVGPVQMPITLHESTVFFQWYTWMDVTDLHIKDKRQFIQSLPSLDLANLQQSSVLTFGNFEESEDAWIRMHSICHTGDIFGSKKCDCGFQLQKSIQKIVENQCGALFYIANQEGRGIGLLNKSLTYILQENGYDTLEANTSLGFQEDQRNYEEASIVLNHLRKKSVSLMTNNPLKVNALRLMGVNISKRVSIWGNSSQYNYRYIHTKINKCKHII